VPLTDLWNGKKKTKKLANQCMWRNGDSWMNMYGIEHQRRWVQGDIPTPTQRVAECLLANVF